MFSSLLNLSNIFPNTNMSDKFTKGDKVKCLTTGTNKNLKVGEIYTVSRTFHDYNGVAHGV